MSKYTTELRFICESVAGNMESVGGDGVNSVIERAIPKIFDFDFPIFKAEYKAVLAKKILLHYYTREIGYETYGLWKLKLNTKLNEIMPYYNQLYESALLEFNPMDDVNYTRQHEGQRNKQEEGNTENTNWNVYSDTPQGTVGNIEDGSHMTSATKITDRNSGTNKVSDVDSFLETVKGKMSGSDYSENLIKYRQTFINIDLLVIEELSDLFMNLW